MLPEVAAASRPESSIRIPAEQDIPITPRLRRVIDSAPLRRLASISQLGMVGLVYPGATHSRLEHSLGVYHNAVKLIARFEGEDFFTSVEAEAFLLAALIHDVGHWPFCHPIEDMGLSHLATHENRISQWIESTCLGELIDQDWNCTSSEVVSLLDSKRNSKTSVEMSPGQRFFTSCLSGPVDVDKLDYLQRDSLHAGVPYGQNFDANRLIGSMCRHPQTGALAISEKGKTAAEMMVFARYVMFSEVYWHHTVRSATAMIQRSVFSLQDRMDLESTLRLDDAQWIDMLRETAQGTEAETMVNGLFGEQRSLFKQAAQYTVLDGETHVHQTLARRPFWWLVACAEKLAQIVCQTTGISVSGQDILIDAPPVKLEVDINIDVVTREGTTRPLGDVSPVTAALAHQQFDNHVKRVRIFVRGELRDRLQERLTSSHWEHLIIEATQQLEQEIA